MSTENDDKQSEESYNKLVAFHKEHGHLEVPQMLEHSELYSWLQKQKELRKKKLIPIPRFERLNDLGFNNEDLYAAKWNEKYARLKRYKSTHGNCLVPRYFPADKALGHWCAYQRILYNRQALAGDRKQKLVDLGFVFAFKDRIPHASSKDTTSRLVVKQTAALTEKTPSSSQANNVDKASQEQTRWMQQLFPAQQTRATAQTTASALETLQPQVKESPMVVVAAAATTESKRHNGDPLPPKEEDEEEKKDSILLPPEETPHRLRKTNKNRDDQLEGNWIQKFERLVKYKAEYGDCKVPRSYPFDNALGLWCGNQRMLFKHNKLREDRKKKLHEIGFAFVINEKNCCKTRNTQHLEAHWEQMFALLIDYKKQNGHMYVPKETTYKGAKLGRWVCRQKNRIHDGILEPERLEKLNSLGFQGTTKRKILIPEIIIPKSPQAVEPKEYSGGKDKVLMCSLNLSHSPRASSVVQFKDSSQENPVPVPSRQQPFTPLQQYSLAQQAPQHHPLPSSIPQQLAAYALPSVYTPPPTPAAVAPAAVPNPAHQQSWEGLPSHNPFQTITARAYAHAGGRHGGQLILQQNHHHATNFAQQLASHLYGVVHNNHRPQPLVLHNSPYGRANSAVLVHAKIMGQPLAALQESLLHRHSHLLEGNTSASVGGTTKNYITNAASAGLIRNTLTDQPYGGGISDSRIDSPDEKKMKNKSLPVKVDLSVELGKAPDVVDNHRDDIVMIKHGAPSPDDAPPSPEQREETTSPTRQQPPPDIRVGYSNKHDELLDSKWNEKFENLKRFKAENGHCKVPRYYPPDNSLGLWCGNQRMLFKRKMLREDRKKKLVDIEFAFVLSKRHDWDERRNNKHMEARWQNMFEALVIYKKQHGNVFVPKEYVHNGMRLGRWVFRQRQNLSQGSLRPDRKQKMESIGFSWYAGADNNIKSDSRKEDISGNKTKKEDDVKSLKTDQTNSPEIHSKAVMMMSDPLAMLAELSCLRVEARDACGDVGEKRKEDAPPPSSVPTSVTRT